ncbi:MAG: FAD-binding oxidoreductase [Anaerolineae bacterium]|nr:FAD-binding oxidoreductase [Thermoflexales bacterium]MDW8395185.1 FAD-binding oxidoreductase [Anaerolineae bacterium]
MSTLEAVQERNYWAETAAAPRITQRDLPPRVDVAVVGGGYTGLAAARELARRGAQVAVLEAKSIGWGASSRNGGMALTGMKLSASALVKRFGLARAKAMFCLSIEALDYVEQLIRSERIDCEFSRCGHLELAWKPSHMEGLQREAELLQRAFDHPVQLIPREALSTETATEAYHGALLDPRSGGLHPARYAAGLAEAADRAGAMLFAHTRVERIDRASGGFTVHTARGALAADHVFVATNGYTDRIVPSLKRRIVPVGSYIIATAPLPEDIAHAISRHRRMMYDTKHFLYYYRLSSDNRLIFGGRAGFVPEGPDTLRESAAILRRGMVQLYPQLANAKVEYAWGGTLGFTLDFLPHAGRSSEGVHYAMGCGGHGVALLTYLGACMGRMISGEPVNNPLFDLPFPAVPLYDGNPWFLPLAGAYYRLLDWLQ